MPGDARNRTAQAADCSYADRVNLFDRRTRLLAACCSALAGFVDATGLLYLGGFFVSFMSGNSTRLAVGLAERSHDAAVAGALIACFVVGVFGGSLVGAAAGPRRRWVVLLLVAALLAAGAIFGAVGLGTATAAAMALAMGAENAIFERDGEIVGLTYMTGTLVKIGQRLASAARGGPRFGWTPYAGLWAGLLAGAVLGAASYPALGTGNLWIGSVAAALLAVAATRIGGVRA